MNIASPKVDPVLLKVAKRIESSEQDDRQFVVEVSNDAVGYKHSEQLTPNNDYTWVTTLRHEGLYSVEETGITGPGDADLDRFTISYKVDGKDKSTCEVHTMEGTLVYQVTGTNVVYPNEVDTLSIKKDKDLVTLVTCLKYPMNDRRLLVYGERVH